MNCSICFEEDTENLIKTECNHYFHEDCIKQIIFPFCPCCKSDIKNMLIKIGVSKKKIKSNIKAEKNRLFINSLNIEELSFIQKYQISINNIKLNKNKWIDIVKKIIFPYIQNVSLLLFKIHLLKTFFKYEGIFIYYVDLKDVIINLLQGYSKNVLQWICKKNFDIDKSVNTYIKNVYNKMKNNKDKKIGVLFIINDNINNKKIIFSEFFDIYKKINYIEQKEITNSLIFLENTKTTNIYINPYNPEKNYLKDMINYYTNIKTNLLNYKYSLKNFIIHKINNIFYNKYQHNNKILGLITLNIDKTQTNIFQLILINDVYFYKDISKNKINNIKTFNKHLMQIIINNKETTYLTFSLFNPSHLIHNYNDVYCFSIFSKNNIFKVKPINNYIIEHFFNENDSKSKLKKNLTDNYIIIN